MSSAVSIILAALLGVALPFAVVNRLFPSLAKHAPKQLNYHGVEVLSGLETRPDVIVVDPPRAGMSVDALDRIISYGVEQIVYISCNPKSLAQNLYQLQLNGYRAEIIRPFDNFPWTKHVECVVLMSRVK